MKVQNSTIRTVQLLQFVCVMFLSSCPFEARTATAFSFYSYTSNRVGGREKYEFVGAASRQLKQQERRHHSLQATKEATFGMGCFWEPSEELLKVNGVIDTVAGYTGKSDAKEPPSYDNVCYSRDWVEGVRVYYDDEKISYQELLQEFFQKQKPKLGSRQYASIIFPHDEEQETMAKQWMTDYGDVTKNDGWQVSWTQIEPQTKFFQAEGYHQQYWQKTRPRIAVVIALLAIATGILDPVTPEIYQSLVATTANKLVLLGGIYILLERFVLDTKVEEL